MARFEIWREGYLATGMEGVPEPAHEFGEVTADTFKEACIKFFSPFTADPNCPNGHFDPVRLTYWGCRLFDNEADARLSFG